MLNFFQYINNLLFSKKPKLAGTDSCSENISGFMLNRWISFYDKQTCSNVNTFCNKPHLTEDPDLLSKFLFVFIPQKSYKKINYINKNKNKKQEDPTDIICKIMQVGKRDAEMIVKTTDEKDLKNFLKIYQTL